jgi:hypothetical protein
VGIPAVPWIFSINPCPGVSLGSWFSNVGAGTISLLRTCHVGEKLFVDVTRYWGCGTLGPGDVWWAARVDGFAGDVDMDLVLPAPPAMALVVAESAVVVAVAVVGGGTGSTSSTM